MTNESGPVRLVDSADLAMYPISSILIDDHFVIRTVAGETKVHAKPL